MYLIIYLYVHENIISQCYSSLQYPVHLLGRKKVAGFLFIYQAEHQPGMTKTCYQKVETQYFVHGQRNPQKVGLYLDNKEEFMILQSSLTYADSFVCVDMTIIIDSLPLNNIQNIVNLTIS